jgi:ribonuclease HI
MLTLRFDGLFRHIQCKEQVSGQSGFMCYGWIITENGRIRAYGHGGIAGQCNANSNAAEYLALIEGLDALLDLAGGGQAAQVYGDAKSVIEQMRGAAQVNASSIRMLHQRASRLAARFAQIEWAWVPRRENHAADTLTRRALRQMRLDRKKYQSAVSEMVKGKALRNGEPRPWRNLLDLRIYQPPDPVVQIAHNALRGAERQAV